MLLVEEAVRTELIKLETDEGARLCESRKDTRDDTPPLNIIVSKSAKER